MGNNGTNGKNNIETKTGMNYMNGFRTAIRGICLARQYTERK